MPAGDVSEQLIAHDLDSMESFLRVCRSELVLLGSSPKADLQARIVEDSLICRVELGTRIRGRFVLPRDWMMLVYLCDADPVQSWCHGISMGTGNLITVMPTGAAEFSLAAGTRCLVAVMPLRKATPETASSPLLERGKVLEPGVRTSGSAESWARQLDLDFQNNALDATCLAEWLDLHLNSDAQPADTSLASLRARRSRYQVFRKAEDFMLANMRRQVYMQEICDAAGTSERTLRYAFDDLTGHSPGRYFSLLRLCAACRALSTADASEKSVKSVALSCGLWDLSRFADSYRSVFGELPRETLQRNM